MRNCVRFGLWPFLSMCFCKCVRCEQDDQHPPLPLPFLCVSPDPLHPVWVTNVCSHAQSYIGTCILHTKNSLRGVGSLKTIPPNFPIKNLSQFHDLSASRQVKLETLNESVFFENLEPKKSKLALKNQKYRLTMYEVRSVMSTHMLVNASEEGGGRENGGEASPTECLTVSKLFSANTLFPPKKRGVSPGRGQFSTEHPSANIITLANALCSFSFRGPPEKRTYVNPKTP